MAKFLNPEGRTFDRHGQRPAVEKAKEVCKESPIVVGLKNKNAVVLIAFTPCPQPKPNLIRVNNCLGVAFTGCQADAQSLCDKIKEMNSTNNNLFGVETTMKIHVAKTSSLMAESLFILTRPLYVCGLLIAGYDKVGPNLFKIGADYLYSECLAQAMGKGEDVANSYLERNYKKFKCSSVEDLVHYGVLAIIHSLSDEECKAAKFAISIDVFGSSTPNKPLTDAENKKYLELTMAHFKQEGKEEFENTEEGDQ